MKDRGGSTRTQESVFSSMFSSRRIILAACAALLAAASLLFLGSCEQEPIGPGPNELGGLWRDGSAAHQLSCVWAASDSAVFAGGDKGAIYRCDGSTWTLTQIATDHGVEALWGRSPSDVYAGVTDWGGQNLLHFDGHEWFPVDTGSDAPPNDLWGDDTGHLFAVCSNTILHFDGTSWSNETLPTPPDQWLRAIWGVSLSDIFVVGSEGVILHFDGAEWTSMESPTSVGLYDVWGTSSTDVYAVGRKTIIHFDGMSWQVVFQSENAALELRGIAGTGPDHVVAVGHDDADGVVITYDGVAWTTTLRAEWRGPFNDISAATDGTMIAVGYREMVVHYDGASWEFVNPGLYTNLNAIWGTGPGNLLVAADDGAIFHFNGTFWWPTIVSKESYSMNAIWGSAERDVFAVGDAGTIAHFDGSTWEPMASGVSVNLHGVWGSGPGDVYAVGNDSTILHFDGANWSRVAHGIEFQPWDIWGASSRNVFVIGADGAIVHFDGAAWRKMASYPQQVLFDIWGVSGDAVFVVGADGTILFYNGSSWQRMQGGDLKTLTAVWGTSFDNVFAASFEGDILHFDGVRWKPMSFWPIWFDANLWGLWGSSPSHVIAVGNWGRILRYDGE